MILILFSSQNLALDLILHIAGYGLIILGVLSQFKQSESIPLLIAGILTFGLLIVDLLSVNLTFFLSAQPILSTIHLCFYLFIMYIFYQALSSFRE